MPDRESLTASVTVRRTLNAPREKVWEAWTSPDALKAWFTTPGHPLVGAECDLRPGGRYILRFVAASDGSEVHCDGVYREIVAPERLVFTWKSSHEPAMTETLVTVDLREVEDGTELTLTHEGFDTETLRREHDDGWKEVLDSLVRSLA